MLKLTRASSSEPEEEGNRRILRAPPLVRQSSYVASDVANQEGLSSTEPNNVFAVDIRGLELIERNEEIVVILLRNEQ